MREAPLNLIPTPVAFPASVETYTGKVVEFSWWRDDNYSQEFVHHSNIFFTGTLMAHKTCKTQSPPPPATHWRSYILYIRMWEDQQEPIKILIRLLLVYNVYAYQLHPVGVARRRSEERTPSFIKALSQNGSSHTACSSFYFFLLHLAVGQFKNVLPKLNVSERITLHFLYNL